LFDIDHAIGKRHENPELSMFKKRDSWASADLVGSKRARLKKHAHMGKLTSARQVKAPADRESTKEQLIGEGDFLLTTLFESPL
jgi:hypothetical protein